jgi:hypothetical protein
MENLEHTFAGVRDPLRDSFELIDLARIAPWVWDEVKTVGPTRVLRAVRNLGSDPKQPQPMRTWVKALRQLERLPAAAA